MYFYQLRLPHHKDMCLLRSCMPRGSFRLFAGWLSMWVLWSVPIPLALNISLYYCITNRNHSSINWTSGCKKSHRCCLSSMMLCYTKTAQATRTGKIFRIFLIIKTSIMSFIKQNTIYSLFSAINHSPYIFDYKYI